MPSYPTFETVQEMKDAKDHECLRCWYKELPAPVTNRQKAIHMEIAQALASLGFEEEIFQSDFSQTQTIQ